MNEVTCAPQARALLFNKATGNWAGKKKKRKDVVISKVPLSLMQLYIDV